MHICYCHTEFKIKPDQQDASVYAVWCGEKEQTDEPLILKWSVDTDTSASNINQARSQPAFLELFSTATQGGAVVRARTRSGQKGFAVLAVFEVAHGVWRGGRASDRAVDRSVVC